MNLNHEISNGEQRLRIRIHSPGIHERSVSKNALEGFEGLFAGDQAPRDFPVVGIEFARRGGAGPHDGDKAHGQRDGTNSVICRHRNQGPGFSVCVR